MSIKSSFIRKIERKAELKQIAKKEQEFEDTLAKYLRYDRKYLKEGDTKLTDEQKEIVDTYWKKYEFAFKAPYETYEAYMNRTGKFDVHYIPYGIRKGILKYYITDQDYHWAFQNKAYLDRFYDAKRHPKIICRKVEGIYYDTNFKKISIDEAVEICIETLKNKEIVIKPSGRSGGEGVVFLAEADADLIKKEFKKIPKLMVVQEAIKQHQRMAELNPSTVNTVRLTTYLNDKEVIPLAALVKIGNHEARVDNYKHGGHILGIHLDGKSYPYALNVEYERVTKLPTGVDLSEGIEIPGFKSVLELATESHLKTPYIKLISWDIAINEDAQAVIIEANHSGDFRMHHALTGPLFGELTESFLDKYLVKTFFRERANMEWNYNEYFDHVEMTKYAGFEKNVVVPAKINGKPVTTIKTNAFYENEEVVSVKIPASVEILGLRAFNNCKNLQHIVGGDNLRKMGDIVFSHTPLLSKEEKKRLRNIVKKNKQ